MTFRELVDITNVKFELNSAVSFTYKNERVEPLIEAFIPPDADVELHHHYWHHMNSEFPETEIQRSLDNKDWNTFNKYFGVWFYHYLPASIWIVYNGSCIGTVPMTAQIFPYITFSECECG